MIQKKLVNTYGGKTLPKSKCRYFRSQNAYFEIGKVDKKDSGDCYIIEGKYYRINSGLITYDHEQKKYVLNKNNYFIFGVIGIFKDKLIFGNFTKNIFKNVKLTVNPNEYYTVIDENLLKNNRFFQNTYRWV